MPTGGVLLRYLRHAEFPDYSVEVTQAWRDLCEATRIRRDAPRWDETQSRPAEFSASLARNETASNRLQRAMEESPSSFGGDPREADENTPPKAVWLSAERTPCPGLARRIPAQRPARAVSSCYELSFTSSIRCSIKHSKWLRQPRRSWRRHIESLLIAEQPCLAVRITTLFSQDPGFVDRGDKKSRCDPRLFSSGCELPVVGYRPLPAQSPLRERDSSPANSPRRVARLDSGGETLHRRIGIWEWASNDLRRPWPERSGCVILRPPPPARAPRLETLAAVSFLRRHVPDLRSADQRGRSDEARTEHRAPARAFNREFDALFTTASRVIFAYHGYLG